MIPYRATSTRWVDGNYFLFKFAKNRNSRTVLNIHGITQLEDRPGKTPKLSALMTSDANHACKQVDQIVVNSEYMRHIVSDLYDVGNEKITVIPNGIDLAQFNVPNGQIVLEGQPSILFVGHLWWIKGVDVLLSSMVQVKSAFPNAKLHIVGDYHGHKNEANYPLMAKQLGIENQVIFHGAVVHFEIPHYYKAASVCVFPSRHEAFSIAMLEAMASGVPIIASNIDRFREIIREKENGLFFKSSNAASLADTITVLFSDSHLSTKISVNAYESVKSFSWEKIAEKYLAVYRQLI
jgi:glycosyltransferase involved in cell wall biosynthesis